MDIGQSTSGMSTRQVTFGVSRLTQSVSLGRDRVFDLRMVLGAVGSDQSGLWGSLSRSDRLLLRLSGGWECCREPDTRAYTLHTSGSHHSLSEREASCRRDKPECRGGPGESWEAFYANRERPRAPRGDNEFRSIPGIHDGFYGQLEMRRIARDQT